MSGTTSAAPGSPVGLNTQNLPNSGKRHSLQEHGVKHCSDIDARDTFDECRCLFCNANGANLDSNLSHMLKSHGFLIPDQSRLVVDVQTLLGYLHLIINSYFQCLHCRGQRVSAEAARHHMIGKGHCRLDISDEHSEFRDFYGSVSDNEDQHTYDKPLSIMRVAQPFDEESEPSICLTSGRVISHRGAAIPHRRRLLRNESPESASFSPDLEAPMTDSRPTPGDISLDSALVGRKPGSVSRTERHNSALSSQLDQVRAGDRASLLHLPTAQQRALLAKWKKEAESASKADRRKQSHVLQKGGRTSMKFFVCDTPTSKGSRYG